MVRYESVISASEIENVKEVLLCETFSWVHGVGRVLLLDLGQ